MSDEIKTGSNSAGTTGRSLLPTGRYLTDIEHVEKTLSNSGKERLSFTFRVVAGPHEGRKMFDDVYLTESALWKLDALSEAIGLEKGTASKPNDPAALINTFGGKRLFVTLSADEYEKDGQTREGRKITAYDTTEATKPQQRDDNAGGSDADADADASADAASDEAGAEASA
jgi:hypothetical protein